MTDGTIRVAVIAVVTPLTVRMKGATTDTVVQRRIQPDASTGLNVGDRVLVAVVERQVTYLGRWDPA